MDELLARRGRLVSQPFRLLALPLALIMLAACGGDSGNPTGPGNPGNGSNGSTSPSTPASAPPVVLVGAGDIAMCDANLTNAFATATLLGGIPDGRIFTAGDNVQDTGSANDYATCFDPSWGRYRSRIFPSPGNHDYQTNNGAPYYGYFGAAAGPPGFGAYSYEYGAWHVIVLNSNVSMKPGSAQAEWLAADLEADASVCTVAYWHHPLFSSGTSGNNSFVRDAWTLLYNHGVDIVLNGHDHLYERFAPQDPAGRSDPARGIREFIVGTGGAYLTGVVRLQPNSEAQGKAWGVLKLTLKGTAYDWEFVGVPGGHFSDAGSAACH
jgi:acid phosphatase type 7